MTTEQQQANKLYLPEQTKTPHIFTLNKKQGQQLFHRAMLKCYIIHFLNLSCLPSKKNIIFLSKLFWDYILHCTVYICLSPSVFFNQGQKYTIENLIRDTIRWGICSYAVHASACKFEIKNYS